ncbi:ydg sra domain-containing protein [Ophiostoma piceae UAMH 11346]|uniref:Ydg sra domain-containing protein n=1 Tax=Ophiostoma piceae (strain UAMH 11346) TaxID=1262450 RepID=S3CAB6_OPHP1|nr:ydg sra domain-containing protein [Ophiostoma piceae UAMH 11346]
MDQEPQKKSWKRKPVKSDHADRMDVSGITASALYVMKMERKSMRSQSGDGGGNDSGDDDTSEPPPLFRLTAQYAAALGKRKSTLPHTPRSPPQAVASSSKPRRGRKPKAVSAPAPASSATTAPVAAATVPAVIPSGGLISSSTATPSYTAPAPPELEPVSEPASEPASALASPSVPTAKTHSFPSAHAPLSTQIAFIKEARQRIIQRLAVQFKSAASAASVDSSLAKTPDPSRVSELDEFLSYLDTTVHMTPQLRHATFIGQGLDLITNEMYCFPSAFVERANALRAKWEALNWGEPDATASTNANSSNDEEDVVEFDDPARAGSSAPRPAREAIDHLPASDHPIYGDHGIMAGVIITKSNVSDEAKHARTVYRRHPFFPQKSAQVFGDNGLDVGSWWPLQIAALVHGAHGSSQGGISGSARSGGAYSIVVSGGNAQYHELDDDRGDVVFYSGSRSHANRDPKHFAEPVNHFTQALVASWKNGKPVRVLRSAPAGGNYTRRAALGAAAFPSRWAPSLGIRYDGLYTIVDMTAAVNEFGGLYERFELRRKPGQKPLEEVRQTSPTALQRRDYLKISEGY